MMDRNTVVALLLITVILVLTPYYMDIVSPPVPIEQSQSNDELTLEESSLKNEKLTSSYNNQSPTSGDELSVLIETEVEEEKFYIETDLFLAEISSLGGGSLSSFELKQYLSADSSLVNLVFEKNKTNLQITAKDVDGEIIDLLSPWVVEKAPPLTYIDSETEIVFSKNLSGNKSITKTLIFYPDSYEIIIKTNLSAMNRELLSGSYSLNWSGGLPPTEKDPSLEKATFNAFVYQGEELTDIKADDEISIKDFNGDVEWVAARTKYFVASLIPNLASDVQKATITSVVLDDVESYSMGLQISAKESNVTKLYLGPLELEKLEEYNNLDKVMNLGWWIITPISKVVLKVIKAMHLVIPNYGVVLLIFSVLVKLLVYPLTAKSYKSTQAMQALAPEIAAIKEKFKTNAQKVNTATMELYKKKGVNPMGGCLPMVIQMPLLFSLFTVFRSTIEFRGEPFFWWIKDLSAPDIIFDLPFTIPIYGGYVCALPIFMAGSMYLQQKMMTPTSMTGEQAQQQKLMQTFMMGFFFLLFNTFPSGLNLYYTTFNILTVLQQKFLTKPKPVLK